MNPDAVPAERTAWGRAALVASLFAVDPAGSGGVAVRAQAGPARDRWLALLRDLLGVAMPVRRVPLHVADGRLLGGLDLAATLGAGRLVADRGLLAEADGGVVILSMAERISPATAARLAGALDRHEVVLERDGLALRNPARFGVVALDESVTEDEALPRVLRDHFAFEADLAGVRHDDSAWRWHTPAEIVAARERLPAVRADDDVVAVVSEAALALGIASLRGPLLALRVARSIAALDGRATVSVDDAALACNLVLGPRATVMPGVPEPPDDEPEASADEDPDESDHDDDGESLDREMGDMVLEAARSGIPAGLLALLRAGVAARNRVQSIGRSGAIRHSLLRGRPAGVRAGQPGGQARLSLIDTLRAAAPWQRLRRVELAARGGGADAPRVLVRKDDFHVARYRQRAETTTIFAVDASGSAALHRLAEAKGAIELLLADCYVRRDRVAVVAFRGHQADLLLPPTRSLARAKRSLAGLPGGGGTPLASALDAVRSLADAAQRRGGTPFVVILTDGQANIARDGAPGRARAREDALGAAKSLRATGSATVVIDTAPRAQPLARDLADACGARYLALPHAQAEAISGAVRAVAPNSKGRAR
jgi:magnesium chelatase subunit D